MQQFSLVQDVPLENVRYQREGIILVDVIDPLIYAKLATTKDEDIKEEMDDDDVGMIKVFATWWASKVEEVEEGH